MPEVTHEFKLVVTVEVPEGEAIMVNEEELADILSSRCCWPAQLDIGGVPHDFTFLDVEKKDAPLD